MTTSREEIAKICDELNGPRFGRVLITGDDSDYAIALQMQAADALLSQQRSLDRVAALCDEAATITTGRTEMQMWGVVEVRRLVGVLGNIRAALESQPSPEVSE